MHNVLITGANRGIGLEHARQYAAQGARVFATARDVADAAELQTLAGQSNGLVSVHHYDAAMTGAAEELKGAIGDQALDLLLANAGTMGAYVRLADVEADSVLDTFRINALAPLMLAKAFAPNVIASERKLMAFQSSLMGSIEDNGSGGAYAYRISKVSLNMIARTVARDLASNGVIVVTLHPGWVQTRMGGPSAKVSVEKCVEGQQTLLDGLTKSQSGRFFNYDGRELPW
ncbi:MAG: SDR family oxidoreductase [Pseudomonadota bacterium]